MVNPLLYRPIKAFKTTAEMVLSSYKGIGRGDWFGFAQKGAGSPNLFREWLDNTAGATDDVSQLYSNWQDNWRMENPDKMANIIDDATGRPIQTDPEQQLSDGGENFTFNEETGITEFHAAHEDACEEAAEDVAFEYVEVEIEQQEMDIEVEASEEEVLEESAEEVISEEVIESEYVEVEVVQQEMDIDYDYGQSM